MCSCRIMNPGCCARHSSLQRHFFRDDPDYAVCKTLKYSFLLNFRKRPVLGNSRTSVLRGYGWIDVFFKQRKIILIVRNDWVRALLSSCQVSFSLVKFWYVLSIMSRESEINIYCWRKKLQKTFISLTAISEENFPNRAREFSAHRVCPPYVSCTCHCVV